MKKNFVNMKAYDTSKVVEQTLFLPCSISLQPPLSPPAAVSKNGSHLKLLRLPAALPENFLWHCGSLLRDILMHL